MDFENGYWGSGRWGARAATVVVELAGASAF